MQQKRPLAILLLLVGFIAIALIAWFFLRPPKKAVQPPPLQHTNIIQAPTPKRDAPQSVSAPPVAQSELEAQEAIKRFTALFVGRIGSYSSVDGFAGMKTGYTQTSSEVQGFLEAERKKMVEAHPAFGVSWGQTTRPVTTNIISALPVLGKDSVEVSVQSQVITENGVAASPEISYQETDVVLKKQGDAWVVTRISWKPFEP